MKLVSSLACALTLAAGAVGADGTKVGMITTLSDDGAAPGIDVRDGFMLALEMSGRKDIEVIIEDDERTPETAASLAERMIQTDKVDVLTGIVHSDVAMAVVPSVVSRGIFYLSPNAGPSQLAGAGCQQNYFNVASQNDNLHEAAGAYASAMGFSNSFIIAPKSIAGSDALSGYKRFYMGNIAGELFTQIGQTDYSAELAQIRASGADSVFFFLPDEMSIAFLQQYADAAVGIPLIGPGFSFDQRIIAAVGKSTLGIRNTAQWSKDLDNPANRKFVAAFQEKFDRLPSLYASQGYDTANLMLSALEKTGTTDADAFRDALKAADFDSVRGKFVFGSNHYPIQDIYVREVIREGDILTNRIVTTALSDRGDAYAAECNM